MFWIDMARYERTRSTGKESAAADTMTLVSFCNDSSTYDVGQISVRELLGSPSVRVV